MRVLGVIPNDPLEAYERKGIGSWLARYYNPQGFFDRVYCLSPLETREEEKFGMHVIPIRPRQLPQRMRQLGVQVLRAYGGSYPANVMAAARWVNIPLVLSVHDSRPELLSENVRVADLVLCTSRAVAQLVHARGVQRELIRILPNRVDRNRFRPDSNDPQVAVLRERFPWRYPIVHVGRRSHEKNLDTVIAALGQLGPEYGLLAIGPGDPGPYRAQAAALGVSDRCHFMDPIPNEALPSYYRWCACLCGPSRWEGFGLVLIEGMTCGARVVTSAIAPMTEYIQDAVNGILVKEYEEPKAMVAAVVRACEDPVMRNLGQAARESTQRFATEVVDALEVEYYREALALSPVRACRTGMPTWWARIREKCPW